MAINLSNADVARLQAVAQAAALRRIKAQAERGIGRAFPQPRNAAILAEAVCEVLEVQGVIEGDKRGDAEVVIRAALQSGPLMQGKKKKKMAVKEKVYEDQGGAALEEIY